LPKPERDDAAIPPLSKVRMASQQISLTIPTNVLAWADQGNEVKPFAIGKSTNNKAVFLAVCAMLVVPCSPLQAQQPQKIYKVGRLSAGSPADPLSKATYEVFQEGLRDLGWVEGKNIVLDNRWVKDKAETAQNLAAELVRVKVDVIVAVGSPMIQAAKQATTAIPIVMSGTGADPVAAGFVASLRQPGEI
jgi:ABC-type uncharacterized transport system substrate-binding protein